MRYEVMKTDLCFVKLSAPGFMGLRDLYDFIPVIPYTPQQKKSGKSYNRENRGSDNIIVVSHKS